MHTLIVLENKLECNILLHIVVLSFSIYSFGNNIFSVAFYNQIAQTMQIPLSYAEDIIGVEGSNIAFIRRSSGAILTVQESRGLPDEITVEIKGTSSQVQMAQQLIQVCLPMIFLFHLYLVKGGINKFLNLFYIKYLLHHFEIIKDESYIYQKIKKL